MLLPESFYDRPVLSLAKDLLGTFLYHESEEGLTIGKIVETEAYLSDDESSHTFRGETQRTKVLFGPPGFFYIYFTYGKYFCMNISAGPRGTGECILIRSLEPIEGISLMQKRRGVDDIKQLCNGPAKLVIAMGISKDHHGLSVGSETLGIHSPDGFGQTQDKEIITTTRIGISKSQDLPLRFYIKDNPFVSKIRKEMVRKS